MEYWLPLLLFVVISTLTPGPNNLLLAASGLNFGLRPTLPHVLGIHLGVYGLVILCGLGLGQILLTVPGVETALKLFATAYLAYLAWQMLGLSVVETQATARPMRIWEASLFQVSNPKAWMMAITGLNLALAADHSVPVAVAVLCCCFATLGTLCNLSWVAAGASLQAQFQDARKRRLINATLAAITVATIAAFWVQ
ncbi:MAG: LysE family translocator [Pseudomonadota bacterium]